MKNFRKNFRKTFKNFRKYWLDDIVVDARSRVGYIVETLIIIFVTALCTFFITKNTTLENYKSDQRDAFFDIMSNDYELCEQDTQQNGGVCVYEFTYEGDIIKNVEIVWHSDNHNLSEQGE